MSKSKFLFTVLFLTVFMAAIPAAYGVVTVHFVGAGSSAMYQGMGVAAVNDLAPTTATFTGGGSIHHYTFKSACPGQCITVLHDPRTNSTPPIPDEPSNIWVVYTCTTPVNALCTAGSVVDVWVYHQVDSTVGVRSILSRNASGSDAAVVSRVDTTVQTTIFAQDVITPALLLHGVSNGSGVENPATCPALATHCDDKLLPSDVWTAISGAAGVTINAGFTDIRAEDAKAATKRIAGPVTNNVSLGYGTVGSQLITSAILSSFNNVQAQGVEFGLPGLPDPFYPAPAPVVPPSMITIPIGQSPVLFLANRTNVAGLGAPGGGGFAFSNLVDTGSNPLASLFSGVDCRGSVAAFTDDTGTQSLVSAGIGNFNVNLAVREPLSGTMNTTEWTEFRTAANNTPVGSATYADPAGYAHIAGAAAGVSQEYNVKPTDNPLNKGCQTGGTRRRAIGTGQMVGTAVKNNANTLGYAFFSFGNVSTIGNSASWGYLTLNQVDPLFPDYYGPLVGVQPGSGKLPVCTPGVNCKKSSVFGGAAGPGNTSDFPHLRNGSYRAWSLLRAICDADGTHHCLATDDPLGTEGLINAAQDDIHNDVATSVADFLPFQDSQYVRSHLNILGGTPRAQPFVHFFDQPMINPGNPLSPPNTLDIAQTALENGSDVGGCILPKNFASTGSSGNNANDTILRVTSATFATNRKYTYTVVSGTSLTALAAKGIPIHVSVTGFPGTYDGQNQSVILSTVGATTFKTTGVDNHGTVNIVPPAGGNASAGNGRNGAGDGAFQCNQ